MRETLETQIWYLHWEDPLEDEMATLPYSCLGNPMDREAWWATVYGVGELDMAEHQHRAEAQV